MKPGAKKALKYGAIAIAVAGGGFLAWKIVAAQQASAAGASQGTTAASALELAALANGGLFASGTGLATSSGSGSDSNSVDAEISALLGQLQTQNAVGQTSALEPLLDDFLAQAGTVGATGGTVSIDTGQGDPIGFSFNFTTPGSTTTGTTGSGSGSSGSGTGTSGSGGSSTASNPPGNVVGNSLEDEKDSSGGGGSGGNTTGGGGVGAAVGDTGDPTAAQSANQLDRNTVSPGTVPEGSYLNDAENDAAIALNIVGFSAESVPGLIRSITVAQEQDMATATTDPSTGNPAGVNTSLSDPDSGYSEDASTGEISLGIGAQMAQSSPTTTSTATSVSTATGASGNVVGSSISSSSAAPSDRSSGTGNGNSVGGGAPSDRGNGTGNGNNPGGGAPSDRGGGDGGDGGGGDGGGGSSGGGSGSGGANKGQ